MRRALSLALAACLAFALDPERLRADGGHAYLAASFFRQKKYDKVLKVLEGLTDPPPRLLLLQGDSLSALDRRPEAVEAYKRLIAKYPTHPESFEARRRVVGILESDKSYAALVDELRAFRSGDPEGKLPYVRLEADALFKAGRYDEAIALLEASDQEGDQRTLAEILRELDRVEAHLSGRGPDPSDFAALRRRGLLFAELKRPAEARATLAAASKLRPDDLGCLQKQAELAEAMRDLPAAEELYRTLVEKAPDEVRFASRLGALYWATGRRDHGKRIWRRLVDHAPGDLQRARLVARLFLEHQDPVSALEVIRTTREEALAPDLLTDEEESAHLMNRDVEAAAAVWLPLLLRPVAPQSGELPPRERFLELARRGPAAEKDALRALDKAIARDPAEFELVLLADELLRERGDTGAIEALVTRLAEAVGPDPATLRDHGERFRELGRPLEASILFLAARRVLGPGEAGAVAIDAAEQLLALGRADEAGRLVLPWLQPEAGPLALRAADLHGRILLEAQGKALEARRHYTEWIPRLPRGSSYGIPWVVMAARAAADAGDLGAAQQAYEALLARPGTNPHAAEIEYRLGLLFLHAGKLEEARQRLRKAAESHPEGSSANDALREVALLLDYKEAGEEALGKLLAIRHLADARRFADYRGALAKLAPADVAPPLDVEYLWIEARVLATEGRAVEALQVLAKGASLAGDGPRAADFSLALAQGLEAAGKLDEASEAYKRYLASQADSMRLEEVRARLKAIERRRVP